MYMTDMAEKAMRFWMALPTSCSEKRKESALFVFQNTAGYLHTPALITQGPIPLLYLHLAL